MPNEIEYSRVVWFYAKETSCCCDSCKSSSGKILRVLVPRHLNNSEVTSSILKRYSGLSYLGDLVPMRRVITVDV